MDSQGGRKTRDSQPIDPLTLLGGRVKSERYLVIRKIKIKISKNYFCNLHTLETRLFSEHSRLGSGACQEKEREQREA